jgi:hypothetical protein
MDFQRLRQAWHSLTKILKQHTSFKYLHKMFVLEYKSPEEAEVLELSNDKETVFLSRGSLASDFPSGLRAAAPARAEAQRAPAGGSQLSHLDSDI